MADNDALDSSLCKSTCVTLKGHETLRCKNNVTLQACAPEFPQHKGTNFEQAYAKNNGNPSCMKVLALGTIRYLVLIIMIHHVISR